MQDQIDRLQALSVAQAADINALRLVVGCLAETVRRDHPELSDLNELFFRLRKQLVQQHLEAMESVSPGTAARLQALLDGSPISSRNYEWLGLTRAPHTL